MNTIDSPNNDSLKTQDSIDNRIKSLEEKFNKRLNVIYKHKIVQLTLQVFILAGISAIIFFKSGKTRDVWLWLTGIYILFLSVLELLELEELRFFLKDNKKVSAKEHDN